MATPKHGQVVAVAAESPSARWIEIETQEPLGFVGGQYVIVDSGQVRPDGKRAKRAYSILSADRNQRRIEFAVQQLPGKICSTYMGELAVGDPVTFSGPWGKFKPVDFEPRPTLVLASDTGITAALGLLCGAAMAPSLAQSRLVWLREERGAFVSDTFVRDRLPAGLRGADFLPIVAHDHPERLHQALYVMGLLLEQDVPEQAFLAGDGKINYGLMSHLEAVGVEVGKNRLESFFNSPPKS